MAEQQVTVRIIRSRRADPDPAMEIREVYTVANNYEYTLIRIGSIRIEVWGDRAGARRMIAEMQRESTIILPSFGIIPHVAHAPATIAEVPAKRKR